MHNLSLQETLSKLSEDLDGKVLPAIPKKSYPKKFNYPNC
ncbi:hypothetical protein NCDO895_0563 [Lactococcus lactis subsp. lactis]|nr:hypothetical protein BSR25_2090 [Lactococcus lactis subsp. lactis bv. diacetylactis]KSU29447.1 hypothetical protein NCDO895_0563 [Lactococcus lactis subsp. lactis]